MHSTLKYVQALGGLFTAFFLLLMFIGQVHAATPPILVQCALPDGTPAFLTFENCKKIHSKQEETLKPAPSEKLVDCVLPPEGKESRLPLDQCRKRSGLVLGARVPDPQPQKTEARKCIHFNGRTICEDGSSEGAVEVAPVPPAAPPYQAFVVHRKTNCDPSGWFCGAPPPRILGGGASGYSYTEVHAGHNSRHGTYWDVRTQSYHPW